ncbi:MAG: type II secretion system protein GspK [Bdellovibrionota bacterium]
MKNWLPKKTVSMLKDESGAALMMAIFTVTMLMVIATEIMYQTNVELVVSSQQINQLKAHYAAKAGVEISLLRIHIFRKAAAMLGDKAPLGMLDPIWRMPFSWPPILPEDTSAVDKDQIAAAVKQSSMQAQYFATIDPEGGLIDINDLASPSKVIADATKEQLLQIFKSRVEGDEAFADKYRGFEFEKVVNNIVDWVDEDKTSLNGGDEAGQYPDRPNDLTPPNAPFMTVDELHMVAELDDDLFEMLKNRVTVYGAKTINPNYAAKEVLMSLHPGINAENADKIIEERGKPERVKEGGFKDEADFVAFLGTLQGMPRENPFRDDKNNVIVPLSFKQESNFRIRSTGRAGRFEKNIVAIVFDFERVKGTLKTFVAPPTPTPGPTPPGGAPATPTPAPTPPPAPPKVPNERPNIVYWNES